MSKCLTTEYRRLLIDKDIASITKTNLLTIIIFGALANCIIGYVVYKYTTINIKYYSIFLFNLYLLYNFRNFIKVWKLHKEIIFIDEKLKKLKA